MAVNEDYIKFTRELRLGVHTAEEFFAGGQAAERKRCAGIVQLSREGRLDTDFRSIIFIIQGGDSLEKIKSELAGPE